MSDDGVSWHRCVREAKVFLQGHMQSPFWGDAAVTHHYLSPATLKCIL